jgi:polysaccharide export outer membrane protein
MYKRMIPGLILAFAAFHAQADENRLPAKELVQYVRDAKKAGLNDGDIQKNAVQAGWPEAAVTDALTAARTTPTTEATPALAVAEPHKNASSGPEVKPAAPIQPTPEAVTSPANAAIAPPAGAPKPPEAAGAPKSPTISRGVPDDYVIGAGDLLSVNVWKEAEASVPSAVVRPDGKISMPLLKEVSVVGLTPKQVEKQITEQLGQFITGADVTIVVSGINSKKVYLAGAVRKEGPIPFTYQMTVMQALSEGGGLSDYAKRTKIYVLRNENGRQFRLPFDYNAVLKGEKMELNIVLQPGDTVVVPH